MFFNDMRKIEILIFVVFTFFTFSQINLAQTPKPQPRIAVPPKSPLPKPPKDWKRAKTAPKEGETLLPAEKSISTDAKVNISLCISEGNVKINGWEHNEIRTFVSGGSQIGFQVLEKKNQIPAWVKILGFDSQKNNQAAGVDECLSGDEIELDVPRGATVKINGGESDIAVTSVNKVKIENRGGDISLNNIGQGIEAKTYQGDVTVENSSGAITLLSTNGNIVAFDTEAGEIGDVFLAKTSSGTITLQKVGNRQIEVNSNSGSIRFDGEFSSGGQYSFGTTNGSINLTIPANSSCKIKASFGGVFQTEIPLGGISKSAAFQQVQNITGTLGTGDSSVNLTTFSGAIRIRKK